MPIKAPNLRPDESKAYGGGLDAWTMDGDGGEARHEREARSRAAVAGLRPQRRYVAGAASTTSELARLHRENGELKRENLRLRAQVAKSTREGVGAVARH
jgi:hypothetical protein